MRYLFSFCLLLAVGQVAAQWTTATLKPPFAITVAKLTLTLKR